MKIVKELIPYAIIIVVVVLIRTFLITPVMVKGSSMVPTLNDQDILLLKKYDKSYKRFDVVALKYDSELLVKRIIGLPGDEVSYTDNVLYINGEEVKEDFLPKGIEFKDFDNILIGSEKVPKNHYLVIGDNRNNSTDSRVFGFVPKKNIKGKTFFRIFPFKKFGKIK